MILQLDVGKKYFSIFLILCYKNGSFECFLAKKSLCPLGVQQDFGFGLFRFGILLHVYI